MNFFQTPCRVKGKSDGLAQNEHSQPSKLLHIDKHNFPATDAGYYNLVSKSSTNSERDWEERNFKDGGQIETIDLL